MDDNPFTPLASDHISSGEKANEPRQRNVSPVPPQAPQAPRQHPGLGAPSQIWTYRDTSGAVLGYFCRFEEKAGGKSFRPLCLFEDDSGSYQWRWEAWPDPRPLYGLDRLAEKPNTPVIVTEGEKACDAAAILYPDYVCVTSPSGSKASGKADWSSLTGRRVIIWPDADAPGHIYADAVAKRLATIGALSIAIILPPDGVPQGWDAADAIHEHWTKDQPDALIKTATKWISPVAPGTANSKQTKESPDETKKRKSPRRSDSLLAVAEGAELWHTRTRTAYASIEVNGHKEHWPVDSVAFKQWMAGRFYEVTKGAPTGQMLADALRVLEVRAIQEGACNTPHMRTAWQEGASWLDLCDEDWRAIKITSDGWEVVSQPPVKFVRTQIMQALPEPTSGHLIEELRGFVNAEEDDFKLIVGWLLAALWGRAKTYPVLALGGEQGSGKSTMARLLRTLVDPSEIASLAPPKDDRDLFATAANVHVLSFDNISSVPPWLSDTLCRLSTGGGYVARKLHTDNEPAYFTGARPIVVNGIPSLTDRADLADRALTVRLLRIDEKTRHTEDELWTDWLNAMPGIVGSLLDALSSAIRNFDDIKLKKMPRMADFAKLMAACEPGLGWEQEAFINAYEANRSAISEAIFESDPVAVAIRDFILNRPEPRNWEGTATELLAELNKNVSDEMRRSRFWPTKVNALGNAVDRAAPALRLRGIHITKHVTSKARLIHISYVN